MIKIEPPRFRRLAKEGFWISCGQVASVLGALALIRVLTERLEPEQYGQLALGLTIAGLVNQVLMGGLSAGISRFYAIAVERNDLDSYLRVSRSLMCYSTIAILIIALIFIAGLLFFGFSQWAGLAAATLGLSILSGYNSALSGIQNAARQRAIVAFHSGLDAWLKILFSVGMIGWLGSSGTAVVLGYLLSSLILVCSQLFFLRQLPNILDNKPRQFSKWMPQIWAYSWPFSVFGAFTWMQQISDRWALQGFTSEYEVGMYAVVFQLGYIPIGLLIGIAMTFLGPILYQRSSSGIAHNPNMSPHQIVWCATYVCLFITALFFVFTFIFHELIFKILVATKYHEVSKLLPWMILAGGIFGSGQMLALKLMSEMKTADMTTAKILTAILGVGLNIYGASQFGIQGIAFALVMFSSVYFFWMAWLAKISTTSVNNNC